MALQQEVSVLLRAVVIHATVAMACFLIAAIQLEIFRFVLQRMQRGAQVVVLFATAALRTRRLEIGDHHAHRYALVTGSRNGGDK